MEVLDHSTAFNESTTHREVTILCSICGTSFLPSSTGTNVCLKCISTTTDISEGITKQTILNFCRTCKRYLRPPWIHAELESKELLALCLRRLRGLNKVKLIDASFIWTEPHSRRIKVKLTIQREVMNNVTVQQTFPIEYVVYYQQCEDCKKEYTPHTWGALVQVRQKADHKKTFLYLEQLILKYNAHEKVLKIKEEHEGVDFFYKTKPHAQRLVDFLQTMFSVRIKHSKQLISQDLTNNTCNYKYVYSIDLPKICKDDLVSISPKLSKQLGGCSNVLICSKVATMVQFIDPINMKTIEMDGATYFQWENDMSFMPPKGNATEFMVFDVEKIDQLDNGNLYNNRLKLARVKIARTSDWEQFDVRTHLGNVLKEGNTALGYDLSSLNFSGFVDEHQVKDLPDVILLRKVFQQSKNSREKIFKLRHLEKENADTKAMQRGEGQKAKDYEEFLNDLEANADMRSHVNLYRNERGIKKQKEANMMQEEGAEGENAGKKVNKKKEKKKLKVKRGKKGAAGDKDEEEEEKEDEKNDKVIKEVDNEDVDDEMVKMEELLDDLNLDDPDEKVEDAGDAIDELVNRLGQIRVEGKE